MKIKETVARSPRKNGNKGDKGFAFVEDMGRGRFWKVWVIAPSLYEIQAWNS